MGYCNLRSLLLAAIIISNCITWTASRHHYTYNVSRHRSRHRRQDAGLYLPASYVIPGGEGGGAWGEWGKPSSCSRTCGGGVASQKRICLQFGPDGQPLCAGGDTKYFSCQTQDCPEGSNDFRAEQCSEYDNISFRRVRYNWVPYTKAPNPCELNCMPRGERFYYRQRPKVIDGTRCNDETFDVCVDGTCQPVGCDLMLGSNAREDKCRVCRGKGTNCRTINGTIDTQDLRKGYNDVLLIPQGATSILIAEVKPSNNYLALRAKQDNLYYLNGEYHIDFPRSLEIAGTLWHYERSQQGFAAPDKLRSLGPTTQPLYLSLLLQDENVGIEYEYSIPTAVAPPPNQQYNWVHEDFTECSATCGGGFQTRNVSCRSREELQVVDDSLCDEGLKPVTNQTCNTQACAARWVEGPWTPCSKPCGDGGTRSREVHCEKIITNGETFRFPSVVSDKECFELLGPKPELYQECNKNASCPTWFTGPWKPCDQLCGEGKQTRQVVCHQRLRGRVQVLADENCADEKPSAEQSCILHPCDGVDWVLSEWSGCDSCLSTLRTRVAECATKDHKVVDSSLCSYHPTPVLEEPCDRTKLPPCTVQWYATQWSNCSVECGKGVQSRRVFCGIFDGMSVLKVEDNRCENQIKYNDTKPCEIPEEKCPAKWFAGPWSECTKECGGGEQFRRVMCLSGGAESKACPGEIVLDSTQACNTGPCNKDEILPVDSKSTPIMDDEYDYEDCEEDEEYPEVGVDEITGDSSSSTFVDLMFSDSPFTTDEGSGTLSTSLTEIESEFSGSGSEPTVFTEILTSEEGSGSESTETGSGEISGSTEPTITEATESSSEKTDFTETDLTETTELSTTDKTSSVSLATGSTITDDTEPRDTGSTETGITDIGSIESGSTEISITNADSTETDSSTEIDSIDTSSTETESTENGSTETGIPETDSTETDSTETDSFETDSTETDSTETGSTVTGSTETGSTETDSTETGSTETGSTETGSTETGSTESDSTETASTKAGSMETGSTGSEITESGSTETDESTTEENTTETGSSESSTEASTTEGSMTEGETRTTEISTEDTEITETGTEEIGTTETSIAYSSSTETSEETPETTEIGMESSTETGTEATTSTETSSTETGSTESSETESNTETSSTTETSEISNTETGSTETGSTETGSTETGSTETGITETGSTEITSTVTGSTETDSTESTQTSVTETGTTETTESGPTETTETVETGITESTTEGSSTPSISSEETSTSWDWSSTVEVYVKKPRCKAKKKAAKCIKSKFGCCPDNRTPAAGPFDEGCPNPKTCKDSKFGCCPDGVSPAAGHKDKGCPITPCNETLFGCCLSDNITSAEGNDQEGCPRLPPPCKFSKHGCCKDGETEAKGPNKEGCPETEPKKPEGCAGFKFGCCLDNKTEANGPNGEGCPCSTTKFGCCPDGVSPALGPQMEGCAVSCNTSTYGCCPDGETPAHGPEYEGCCLQYSFGCCPDNYKPADGPHLEGCGCQYARFGCCPDNMTIARGSNKEGCGCQYTEHGCCPDRHTEARGPNFEGCACHTYQFGCCPDGITIAKGPNLQGCHCQQSKYGCCGDGVTAASGPSFAGCDCSSSKYGCCPDGQTEAQGQKFLGCTDVPENRQAACSLATDRGPCRNYSVYWYYDMAYGGCSRFWYGGCEGNGNRFNSKEDCEDVCVQPQAKDACKLPMVKGACVGYHLRWYYDSAREQCGQFVFGGCLGNANNFESQKQCQTECEPARSDDQCKLTIERGSCAGNFVRWGFNAEAGRCEQFIWGGCEGNNNRFSSEAACVQRCDPPGAPKSQCWESQEVGNCTEKHPTWSFSQTENRCVPFYYSGCGGNGNRFDTRQSCEEACPSAYVQDVCTLPALTGECANYREKWFYDTAEKRCRQFYYGGCGGNGNNFATERECQSRCSESVVATTTTTTQPQTPEPFTQDFCFLEKDPGPCNQFETRWTYDSALGVCSPFEYGGCGGNRNNFPSQEYCSYYCEPMQDICQLPMRAGPCNDSLMRWFYDPVTDACSQFTYGGCEGNDNRFETQQECERRCRTGQPQPELTPAPTTSTVTTVESLPRECETLSTLEKCMEAGEVWYYEPSRRECVVHRNGATGNNCRNIGTFASQEACERSCGAFRNFDVCRYRVDPGPCNELVPKFYFDEGSRSCQQFTYGGCHGGPNRFSTIEECQQVCKPETDPCKQPMEPGNCVEYHVKWYYDEARDICHQFVYGGCSGNDNRFDSQEECEGRCKKQPLPEVTAAATTTTTTTTTTTAAPYTQPQQVNAEECRTPDSLEPCGRNITVFYYDSSIGACRSAGIGGCRYPNSYRTEEECERQCGAFRGLDPCAAPLDPGPCRAQLPKVFWDAASGRCQPFAYGGCAGGPNRFSTLDECEEVCGSTGLEPACRLPVATGSPACGGTPTRRWRFSEVYGDCLAFVYYGCDGNDNNFLSYEQCAQLCNTDSLSDPNEVLPDCDRFNEECSRLHCQYGVQRTRTVDGCERCSCVQVETDCKPLTQECQKLKCNYGIEKTVGDDGCERCKCIDHPCAKKTCPSGERCVATTYRDAVTQEPRYSANCRIVNKPGSCPEESAFPSTEGGCRRECNDDADCRGAGKCCAHGCSQLCLEPAAAVATHPYTPATSPLPRTTYVPELPQAPQANPLTEPTVTSSEGGKATLRCLFHGNPPPKITWQRNEIIIDGSVDRYRLLSDGALEIVSLYRNDSGVYICVADNGLGTARQEIRLQVTDAVEGPAGIAGDVGAVVTAELGRTLNIGCLAYGYPQPSIAWYRGLSGPMVPYSSNMYEARGNVLTIRKLNLETLGEYACQAYNGIGKPASWSVVVQAYKPDGHWSSPYLVEKEGVVVVTPREPRTETTTTPTPEYEIPVYTVPVSTNILAEYTTVSVGSELSLQCEVDGYPVPDVYWTKDDNRLSPSDRMQITEARLTISGATVEDSGVYGCHASNAFSSHQSTVQINVQGLYIPAKCTDNPFFANCQLIVRSKFCHHKYYSKFCCRSCVEAGQLNPDDLDMQADDTWAKKKK